MKQSTKLLSIVLALVMCFGCFSVVGNAALVKGDVGYDSIDNADLTPEQVADVLLDMVDEMLAGMDGTELDLSVLGSLNYGSINSALQSVGNLAYGELLNNLTGGDATTLLDAVKNNLCKEKGSVGFIGIGHKDPVAYSRNDGDVFLVGKLLGLLNDLAPILKKAPKGLLVNGGVEVGGLSDIIGGLVDLTEINNLLQNVDLYVAGIVYDALIYGNKGYTMKSKEFTNKNLVSFPSAYSDVNSLDKILNKAANMFLTNPQDYEMEGEGDNAVKVWDENSVVSKLAKQNGLSVNINNSSLLAILDSLLDTAFDEFGPTVLNNDVKKLLMEATGVDFIRIKNADEIAKITAQGTGYIDVAASGARSTETYLAYDAEIAKVKNYLCDAQMWNVDGVWYFRDYVNETLYSDDGFTAVTDEEGNAVSVKTDRFFKADTSSTNAFYDLVNWDYYFTPDDITFVGEGGLITKYKSIFKSVNDILYKALKVAIDSDVVDVDTIWAQGPTYGAGAVFNSNLINTVKFVLNNDAFAKEIFGKSSPYVVEGEERDAFKELVASDSDATIVDLVEYIGLPLFADVMPQLIMPEGGLGDDSATKVYKFGISVIREFMTEIASGISYDAFIYEDLTSADGRKYVEHTTDEWFNLFLNMGADIAYILLENYTNFRDYNDEAIPAPDITAKRWQDQLNKIIDWAAEYVGSGSTSVLNGLDPNALAGSDPFARLSKALNTVLPLGFISNCYSDDYAFDLGQFFNVKVRGLVESLDLEGVLSLFGRENTHYNFLKDTNVVKAVLDLADGILKLVLGRNFFGATDNCAAALSDANLGTALVNLVTGLNERKDAILNNALPVVAQFIPEVGGEQSFASPAMNLAKSFDGTTTLTIANGSKGVWRHGFLADGTPYQDEQYGYRIVSVTGNNCTVSGIANNTTIGFGGSVSATVTEAAATDMIGYVTVNYQILDEDGAVMGGKTFTKNLYFVAIGQSQETVPTVTKSDNSSSSDRNRYTSTLTGYLVSGGTVDALKTALNNLTYTVKRVDASGYNTKDGTISIQSVAPNGVTGLAKSSETLQLDRDESGTIHLFNANGIAADLAYGRYTATATVFFPKTGEGLGDNGKDKTATGNVYVYYYNEVALNDLTDEVNSNFNADRVQSQFKTASTDTYEYTYTDEFDVEHTENLNGADCWANYTSALNTAALLAYHRFNTSFEFDDAKYVAAQEALEDAAKRVDFFKKTAAELALEGGDTNDAAVEQLIADFADIEDTLGNASKYDYRAYRWDRYADVRRDVRDIISKYEAAGYLAAETKYFPYNSSFKVTDLNNSIAGNDYEAYIKALYVDYDAEQAAKLVKDLQQAKANYNALSAADIANANNLIKKTSNRLLELEYDDGVRVAKNYYITQEIESAINQIGTENSDYSERSWTRYENALDNAQTAAESGTANDIFDAKYELQVARNNLRTEDEEASYEELEMLMEQAQAVLDNADAYGNAAKDFGNVLAALGMDPVADKNGNDVQLFPNAALRVNENSYAADDQKKVDKASNALRVALGKMTFKNTVVENTATEIIGKDDKDNNITLTTSHINPFKTADDVLDFFTLEDAEFSVVSVDNNYALDIDDVSVLTGTGSTLTFYKEVAGINVPLVTITIIVDGDVNGDGAVDVLDLVTVELTSNAHASLEGLFKVAANVDTANAEITAEDYSAVVDIALNDYSEEAVISEVA